MLVLLSVQSSGFNISYWKSQNLTCVHHLEDVSIPIFNGDNEVEFAAYLLENARNLKKMVIYHSGHHSTAIKWLQNKSFCYSTAKVIFMEKSSNRSWKKAGLIFFFTFRELYQMLSFQNLSFDVDEYSVAFLSKEKTWILIYLFWLDSWCILVLNRISCVELILLCLWLCPFNFLNCINRIKHYLSWYAHKYAPIIWWMVDYR